MSHYIDGAWIAGEGSLFESINPATNEVVWQGSIATDSEIHIAFEAAKRAQYTWQLKSVTERATYLQNYANLVRARHTALAKLISMESGKPLWEAETEVHAVIQKVNLSLKAYATRCATERSTENSIIRQLSYKPIGISVVIGPFNFPAHLSNGHIVPALLAGNTILYKPSELTPAVANFIMQCWHDSGLPKGVLQCLQGNGKTAAACIAKDIHGVFFTGSYSVGQAIHQQLALRPEVLVALEMGGNNALLLDETLKHSENALHHAITSTLITAGQRCSCARRLIIPNNAWGDNWLSQFVTLCGKVLIGPYTQKPEPFMGPLIRNAHAEKQLAQQQLLIQAGGQPLLLMQRLLPDRPFLSPGIIDMTTVSNPPDEEIFAPFIQIYRYHHFDEALMIANQTHYGLAAALFSDSHAQYVRFHQTVRAGLLNWNRPTTGASSLLPFGGVGRSGNYRPSGYFAADYSAYPVASLEQETLTSPDHHLPGIPL